MNNRYQVVGSVVLYKTDPDIVNHALRSFLDTRLKVHLYITDNSPTNSLKELLIQSPHITYVFNGKNQGFSKGHNEAFRKMGSLSEYFLFINPDIFFDNTVLSQLYQYMHDDVHTGLISPRILNPTGILQPSCRLLPAPLDLVIRRLPFSKLFFKRRMEIHQYKSLDVNGVTEVPFLLGCFLFVRTSVLETVGLFDERFFIYMEDVDLCRRIAQDHKIIYYGKTEVFHYYQRASSRSLKYFTIHMLSLIKYFNKWGWFHDRDRDTINNAAQSKKQVEVLS